MAEGASGTQAPAQAPQSNGARPAAPAGKVAPPSEGGSILPGGQVKAEGQAPGPDAWGEAEEKTFSELLKKRAKSDPRMRTRIRGDEKPIESIDDLYRVVTDAQRVGGATKVVEEAKKARAQAESVMSLVEKAKSGDLEAIYELVGDGGLSTLEKARAQRMQEAEAERQLAPEAQELLRRNRELEAEKAAHEKQLSEWRREKEAAAERETLETVKREAGGYVKSLLEELKLPETKRAAMLPFVARAMDDLRRMGLQLNDAAPQAILEHAKGMASEAATGWTADMTPAQRFDFHGEEYVKGLMREFMRRKKMTPSQSGQPQAEAAPAPTNGAPSKRELMHPELMGFPFRR